MEPCSDVVTLPLPIDWTYCHNDDLEWTYMLNRMKFMEDLAFASLYKGDNRYRDSFEFYLEDWMRQHGDGETAVVWRKIDCALRIVHLIRAKAFLCACQSWNNRCESLFSRLAGQTSEYLLRSFTSVDAQSNWGFIETNALIQLAIMQTGKAGFAETVKEAMRRLELMVTLQIGGDGVHLEQSPGYHHEVLRNLFECVHLSELNGICVPADVKEGLKKMFKASSRMIRPDGSQPQFGDSDILDIRPFMALAAYRYHDESFVPPLLGTVTFDTLWYTAGDLFCHQERYIKDSNDPLRDWLEDSGLQIARSGWERHSDYVCMNAGEMGLSAHGHDDLTHFEWLVDGVPFVISTGRGTYRESSLRKQLKTAKGHNMVLIDDKMPSTYGDTWSWLQEAAPVNAKMTSAKGYTYMRAAHDGYLSLQSGGLITRELILTPRGSLVVIDSILGGGSHHYQQAFHVSERFTVWKPNKQTLRFNYASLSIKMQQCTPG
ncbi:heparinase II/III family protein [Salisediminibacterium selenitireducens]|uniref:Heparinase II/III family protein n=1 Tax=Bacillus selenitireducens (strain ATCC 700615 / DSM 15326 / MLS10) TaxID=439292 RepID=D6XXD5_BACIE|nr:heparinase II/III family protein [Salisediminibacterium selenitireducens]ADH97992.1 Heparinase II/III family protein [[Bacillus] selenitireducens MLS10]